MIENERKAKNKSKDIWIGVSVIGSILLPVLLGNFLLSDEKLFIGIIGMLLLLTVLIISLVLGFFIAESDIPKHAQIVSMLGIVCLWVYLAFGGSGATNYWLSELFQILKAL